MNHLTIKPCTGRWLIPLIILLFITSCARLPEKKPLEKEPVTKPVIQIPKEQKKPEVQVSVLDILITEAQKFKDQKNFQDALFVYNQALSEADESQMSSLMESIESTLSKMPSDDINEFVEIKNLEIPRPLLLYWFGLNAALENKKVQAKVAFETFLFESPEHPYAQDVADLLSVIKHSLFKRNTIGCLLPLTGKYAIVGQQALSGIQLAIQELTKTYNKEFNLIIKDTQANPARVVEAVQQLHQQNVAAILGPLLTVSQAGQEAEKLGIPLIGLTQKNDFSSQGEFLFSNFITPQMQVHTLGAYLFRELGIKKVAILYPDEKYGKRYMELFWDVVDEYDGEVVGVESYDGKKTDFTTPIQKLTGQYFPVPDRLKQEEKDAEKIALASVEKESSPSEIELRKAGLDSEFGAANELDKEKVVEEEEEEKIQVDFEALFIPDSPSKVNLILPQLAFNDAKGMYLVGTNLWHHKNLLKNARGYNKRAIITDGFLSSSQNLKTLEFTKKYEHLFKKTPKFLEAISYDTAMILYTAAMDDAVDSRVTLIDALKTSRIFEGVTGNTIFNQEGRASRQLFLITIKKGRFVEISRGKRM